MQDNKVNNILKQGTILAAVSIIVRLIGMLYQIPLTYIIGDKGNDYYNIAFQIYNIALIISSYGMPLAVSKLISAKLVQNHQEEVKKYFLYALILAILLGGFVGSFVFVNSNRLALFMKTSESSLALKILSPTILCVSILGVFRGYFQGHNNMIPTALSQVLEQIVNAVVSVGAAWTLMRLYKDSACPLVYGVAGSTLGTFLGAFSGLVGLLFIYYAHCKKNKKSVPTTYQLDSGLTIIRLILCTLFPVIVSQTLYQLGGFLDTAMWNRIMDASEMEKSVREICIGVYARKYLLLLNVPLGIATAMGTSIIPSLVQDYVSKNYEDMKYRIRTVIKFNMLLAIPCAVGFTVLGKSIIFFIFPGQLSSLNLAGNMFLFGSFALVFYALSTVTTGVLQSINRMRLPVIHSAISLVIHVLLVYLLLIYTDLGIYALIVGNVTFPLIVCILNGLAIAKYLSYHQEIRTTMILPLLSAIVMGMLCLGSYHLVYQVLQFILGGHMWMKNMCALFISILLGILCYFVCLFRWRIVTDEEVLEMPMGKQLLRLKMRLCAGMKRWTREK